MTTLKALGEVGVTNHAHHIAEGISAIEHDKQELDPVASIRGLLADERYTAAVIRF